MIHYNGGTITPARSGAGRLAGATCHDFVCPSQGIIAFEICAKACLRNPLFITDSTTLLIPAGVPEYSHSVSNK